MEMLPKDLDYYGTLLKKLAPPLVTLLSAEPELQYVALRNINLIVQKRCVTTVWAGDANELINTIFITPGLYAGF